MVRRVAGGVAALAGAHLDLHHRAIPVHESLLEEGVNAENRRGGVAPGAGDEARSPYLFTVQLGDAVYEVLHEIRPRVCSAVPALVLVRIVETKVGAQVDQLRRQRLERLDAFHGLAVGQAEEQQVARLQLVHAAKPELRPLAQVGMGLEHELAGEALRGDLAHLHPGMPQQQAQELPAGVAGRPHDGDLQLLRHGSCLPPQSTSMIRVMSAGPQAAPFRSCSARPTRSTCSTTRPGMFTPVVSILFRNSIV